MARRERVVLMKTKEKNTSLWKSKFKSIVIVLLLFTVTVTNHH